MRLRRSNPHHGRLRQPHILTRAIMYTADLPAARQAALSVTTRRRYLQMRTAMTNNARAPTLPSDKVIGAHRSPTGG